MPFAPLPDRVAPSHLRDALAATRWPTVFPVLAALPFLPLGKGALILIAGGSVVLAFSLVWSLVSRRADPASISAHAPRPQPPHRRRSRSTHAVDGTPWIVTPSEAVPPVEPWMPALMARVRHARRGRARLVRAQPGQHKLLLVDCTTCRERPGIAAGCEAERKLIEDEARTFERRTRVIETLCNANGACEFELWVGGLA